MTRVLTTIVTNIYPACYTPFSLIWKHISTCPNLNIFINIMANNLTIWSNLEIAVQTYAKLLMWSGKKWNYTGHRCAVVTHLPSTSEVGGSNPKLYVGKLVVSYLWSAVYSTLINCMYWFPLSTKPPVVIWPTQCYNWR